MSGLVDELVAAGMSPGAAESRSEMFARAEIALRARDVRPRNRFHVPGRIEVLGKHTDYAGGRSLLSAVERGFCVVSAPRNDGVVRLFDVGRGDEVILNLDREAGAPEGPHWGIYPNAVTRRLVRDFGPPIHGADVAFVSDLPPSSGLSSSSALLIATFEALRLANDLDARDDFRSTLIDVLDVAAYLGSVESGRPFRGFGGEAGVGTSGGSQDHTAILASEAGRICQFGYAPARLLGAAALPSDTVFVIGVSGVVAQKTAGARAAFNRAAALTSALLNEWRQATGENHQTLFEAMTSSSDALERLGGALRVSSRSASAFPTVDLEARLNQFAQECLVLIPEAFAALLANDLAAFGRTVDRSQRAAETGLQNQVPETIDLARLARSLGAHAASSFGAGFGGSVWALVARSNASVFRSDWERAYRERHDHMAATFFVTEAGPALLRIGL